MNKFLFSVLLVLLWRHHVLLDYHMTRKDIFVTILIAFQTVLANLKL